MVGYVPLQTPEPRHSTQFGAFATTGAIHRVCSIIKCVVQRVSIMDEDNSMGRYLRRRVRLFVWDYRSPFAENEDTPAPPALRDGVVCCRECARFSSSPPPCKDFFPEKYHMYMDGSLTESKSCFGLVKCLLLEPPSV